MKPSEEIERMVRLYRLRYPEDYDAPKGWIIAIMSYLDEQYEREYGEWEKTIRKGEQYFDKIINSKPNMKKTKKVNKLKTAKTAVAKKAIKKAKKK